LEETGTCDQTLIIFTSDHGELLGDYRIFGKASFYPEAYHVPLIIVDPSREANAHRGRIVQNFSEGVDVLPTILEWLSLNSDPSLDGRSLLSYISGQNDPKPKTHVLCEHDFCNDRETYFVGDMALDRRHRSLSMVLDEHAFYVRFSGLPDLCFKIDEFEGLHYHYATGIEADKIRIWGLTTQLDHRLKNAANGRTALVATDKGFELRG
jgi:hypothetical protein